ncbi:hypothetical protein ABPG73_016140 [Tetrahymena malaccensis]
MDKIDQTSQQQTNSDVVDSISLDQNGEANQKQIQKSEETQFIPVDTQNNTDNNLVIKLSKVELDQKITQEIFNKEEISQILEFICKTNQDLDQHNLEKNMKHFNFKHCSLQTFGRLSQYADSNINNQQIKEAYHKSDEDFPYQILIRGDGNCFYRSFMINIMFKIIINQDVTDALNMFKRVFKLKNLEYNLDKYNESKINLTSEFKMYFLHFWISKFIDCHKILGQQQQYDLKNVFEEYNQLPFVDVSTVVICRNIILNKFNLLLRDPSYCFFITEESKVNSPKILLQYGQEAEDVIIPIAAKAFQVDLQVKNIYRNQQKIITELFEYKFEDNKKSNTVTVLFTQGHYNCLFEKQLYDQSTDKFIWPQQEIIQIEQQQQQKENLESGLSFQYQPQEEEEIVQDIKNSNNSKIDNQLDIIFQVGKRHGVENNQPKQESHHLKKTEEKSQSQKIQKTQDDKRQQFFDFQFNIFSFLKLGLGFSLILFLVARKYFESFFKGIQSKL